MLYTPTPILEYNIEEHNISGPRGEKSARVISEGLSNEDKVALPKGTLLPLPADSNRGAHDWESVVWIQLTLKCDFNPIRMISTFRMASVQFPSIHEWHNNHVSWLI